MIRRFVALVGAMALVATQPVQAACIDEPVRMAARLHEFEIMMQSIMLRCSKVGIAMQDHFGQLEAAQRARFDEATGLLKHYFTDKLGVQVAHKGSLDLLSTIIANKYGGGNTNLVGCRQFDFVLTKASIKAAGKVDMLSVIATGLVARPTLEQRFCPAEKP